MVDEAGQPGLISHVHAPHEELEAINMAMAARPAPFAFTWEALAGHIPRPLCLRVAPIVGREANTAKQQQLHYILL